MGLCFSLARLVKGDALVSVRVFFAILGNAPNAIRVYGGTKRRIGPRRGNASTMFRFVIASFLWNDTRTLVVCAFSHEADTPFVGMRTNRTHGTDTNSDTRKRVRSRTRHPSAPPRRRTASVGTIQD